MEPKCITLAFNNIHKYNFHRLWISAPFWALKHRSYIFLFKNTSSTLNPYWWVIVKNYNILFFLYNIFCCMMHQSVATYDYDLCYLHKVLSPWDINTYLLKYMVTIHLPEKKFMQKEEHFEGFLSRFSHNNFPFFIAFLLLQVIIILVPCRISHRNVFIGSNVRYPRQHRNPQFTDSLSLQWALKDAPIDLMKFLGGLGADLSGSLSWGLPEVKIKLNLSKTLCACLILLIYVCSAQIVSTLRNNSDFNPEYQPWTIRLVAYLYKFSGSPCNQNPPATLMLFSTFWFCKWFSPGPPGGNGFRKAGMSWVI